MGATPAVAVTVFVVVQVFSVVRANYGYGTYAHHQDDYGGYGYDDTTNISSPTVTNWGVWGSYEECPYGQRVRAFQLKVMDYDRHKDNTAVEGLKLFCGDPNNAKTVILTSSVYDAGRDDRGRWKSVQDCFPGYAIGFQLRVLPAQSSGGDDMATMNVRIFCSSGYGRNEKLLEGDGVDAGSWGDVMRCPCNHAFCGLQTQVEPHGRSNNDDTALNNIVVGCCPCTKSKKKYDSYQSSNNYYY